MVNKDESASGGKLKEPVRLNSEHVISEFNSGHESLDHWLNYKALHNLKRTALSLVNWVH